MTPSKPTTVLLAAVGHEMFATVQQLQLQRQTAQHVYVGQVGSQHVIAALTGVGAQRSGDAAGRLIDEHQPQQIINIGFAGSLIEGTAAGEVIEFAAVTDGATTIVLDQARGQAPLLLTYKELAYSSDLKRQLAAQYGAAAVDMESFHLAKLAEQRGAAMRIVRAISDPIDMSVPPQIVRWVRPDGTTDVMAAGSYLATHPWQMLRLKKLQANSNLAAKNLARYVADMLQ